MEINHSQRLPGLYGSQIDREKAVGFCYLHKCHLTENTLKYKRCLGKQCHHLKKHEDNVYWKNREERKALKKSKKIRGYN